MKSTLLCVMLCVGSAVNAWGQGNCGGRQASCNPGQYVDTSGNQAQCRACTGNTASDGCGRDCSACGAGTLTNGDHSKCVAEPPGTYKDNSNPIPFGGGCQPTMMDGGVLHATCPNYFGVKGDSTLADADKCTGDGQDIENINGSLKCVLSSTKSPNGHGDVFDLVSKTESQDSSGKTTHWRIDHPNVSQGTTLYPKIVFGPGDNIKVDAGGCVHTNGGVDGQRWKQYVNPDVDFQQRTADTSGSANGAFWSAVFAGGLQIGAVGGKSPLSGFVGMGEPFFIALPPDGLTIPGSGSATFPKQFVLSLLYYDNEFRDNGYYSHDDGTNEQCKNDGPAWVDFTVFQPKTPIAYSHFGKGENFDLAWRTDEKGVDDNGLPLNPFWSYQIENPDTFPPNFQPSCAPNRVVFPGLPTCTSQPTTIDTNTDSFLEQFGYCNTSDSVLDGHINWQRVTYQGYLTFRAWSGTWPDDDDINFGLNPDDDAGQTYYYEGPDTGIGLEFKNSDTTANYTTPFWKAFGQNATSPDELISVNGNKPMEFANGEYGVATGLMGIDGVHKGYSELHPVFAMAIEVVWTPLADGGEDETWAFFIRNEGNEGSCAHLSHYWPSPRGDWTYGIQLPWPDGATSVQVVPGEYTQFGTSGPGQEYLGMQGAKPWTYLRFKLPDYTGTGINGEIVLHYAGATSKNQKKVRRPARASDVRKEKEKEGEFGIDWTAFSSRIADPATRQKFLSEVNEVFRANHSGPTKDAHVAPIDPKETTFTHPHDFGAWIDKPATDVTKPDTEKLNIATALKAVIAKYSAQLHLAASQKK